MGISCDQDGTTLSKHISPLSIVQTFMNCFTANDKEGKVIIELSGEYKVPTLRYVVLNPSIPFLNVRKEAYGFVLAGGTSSPFTHVISELLGVQEVVNEMKQVDNEIMASKQ